eukprot:TRINITY_DN10506_c0_g1_i1.p1 TRINITY_DN10506_c0_g1~~TRINITY_DN10506_c0_g1_i1.p1  ORF type:complete len:470 (-),score=50.11 TRINITY_DN10506_c0_g1_i1:93-1502(-)
MNKNENKKNNAIIEEEFRFDKLPAIANTKIINDLDLSSLCRFSCVNQFTNKRIGKELLELRWRENFAKHFPLIELSFCLDFPNSTWKREYFKFVVQSFEENMLIDESDEVEVYTIYNHLKKRIFYDILWINLPNYLTLGSIYCCIAFGKYSKDIAEHYKKNIKNLISCKYIDPGGKCHKLILEKWEKLSDSVEKFLGMNDKSPVKKSNNNISIIEQYNENRYNVQQSLKLKLQFIHFCASIQHFPALLFETQEYLESKNSKKKTQVILWVSNDKLSTFCVVSNEERVYNLNEIKKFSFNLKNFNFTDIKGFTRIFKTYQGSQIASELDKKINQCIFNQSEKINELKKYINAMTPHIKGLIKSSNDIEQIRLISGNLCKSIMEFLLKVHSVNFWCLNNNKSQYATNKVMSIGKTALQIKATLNEIVTHKKQLEDTEIRNDLREFSVRVSDCFGYPIFKSKVDRFIDRYLL